MCFLLAGASRSPSGTKAPSPELETDVGCGTGLKCDHKCISYDGVSQCACRDGYQLHLNGYSCVGKQEDFITEQTCCQATKLREMNTTKMSSYKLRYFQRPQDNENTWLS